MADLEPEEVANDFGDDNNNAVAMPANEDDQSVSTFNYAQDSAPAFLKGVPQEVPVKQGREATLGSAVVTLNSQQKPRQAVGSIHSELIYASNRDTEVQANGDKQVGQADDKGAPGNKRYARNPTHRETQLASSEAGEDYRKRPSETDMVVMEFGDLEERKRSRKSRHLTGQKITEEDNSSDELSLADI